MTALLLAALPGPLFAQETLSGTLRQVVPRGRTGAPVEVEVTLRWPGRRLLEGQLEFAILENGRRLGFSRTDALVVSGGDQSFPFALTAPPSRCA